MGYDPRNHTNHHEIARTKSSLSLGASWCLCDFVDRIAVSDRRFWFFSILLYELGRRESEVESLERCFDSRLSTLDSILLSAFVSQHDTVAAHGPADLLAEVERVEVLFGAVLLLDPRSAAVV